MHQFVSRPQSSRERHWVKMSFADLMLFFVLASHFTALPQRKRVNLAFMQDLFRKDVSTLDCQERHYAMRGATFEVWLSRGAQKWKSSICWDAALRGIWRFYGWSCITFWMILGVCRMRCIVLNRTGEAIACCRSMTWIRVSCKLCYCSLLCHIPTRQHGSMK